MMTKTEELLRRIINKQLRELGFNEDNRLGVLTLFGPDIKKLQEFHEYLSTTDLKREDRGAIYNRAREITGQKYMYVVIEK